MELSAATALFVYAVCLFGYHHIYFWITAQERYDTKKGRIDKCVKSWFERIFEDDDHLLVVHLKTGRRLLPSGRRGMPLSLTPPLDI